MCCERGRGNPRGFSVFFAGHWRSIANGARDIVDYLRRIRGPVRSRLLRDRWRVTSSIQRYPQQPGGPVTRGVRKNGVTYARSWRYIPLYAKSRGIPVVDRYGRYNLWHLPSAHIYTSVDQFPDCPLDHVGDSCVGNDAFDIRLLSRRDYPFHCMSLWNFSEFSRYSDYRRSRFFFLHLRRVCASRADTKIFWTNVNQPSVDYRYLECLNANANNATMNCSASIDPPLMRNDSHDNVPIKRENRCVREKEILANIYQKRLTCLIS
jgi:hypothetical protein